MNHYSDDNPPKRGNAKIIYDAFKRQEGWLVKDLHYNHNCWGAASGMNGWGTWACEIWATELSYPGDLPWFFCGVKDGLVYVQRLEAPFDALFVIEPE